MIFPYVDRQNAISENIASREYAWDFDSGDFKLMNGRPYIVEGLEALKIRIIKTLKTERYNHLGYSWNYGSELNQLIGKKINSNRLEMEVRELIEDALLMDPEILSVNIVKVRQEGRILHIQATINTKYGEVDIDV